MTNRKVSELKFRNLPEKFHNLIKKCFLKLNLFKYLLYTELFQFLTLFATKCDIINLYLFVIFVGFFRKMSRCWECGCCGWCVWLYVLWLCGWSCSPGCWPAYSPSTCGLRLGSELSRAGAGSSHSSHYPRRYCYILSKYNNKFHGFLK